MPEVTSHAPGSFCWIELGTSDPDAAKKFYSGLFGWEAQDTPAGPDMIYTMLTIRGLDIGAMYKLGEEESKHGVPPHWNTYVAVGSADEAARKAASLGGTVVMEAFDVGTWENGGSSGPLACIASGSLRRISASDWSARPHVWLDELWTTDTRSRCVSHRSVWFGQPKKAARQHRRFLHE